MIFHGCSNSVCVPETRDSGDLLELPEPQVTGCAGRDDNGVYIIAVGGLRKGGRTPSTDMCQAHVFAS